MFRHSFGFFMSKNLIFKVFGIKFLGLSTSPSFKIKIWGFQLKICHNFGFLRFFSFQILVRHDFGFLISKF